MATASVKRRAYSPRVVETFESNFITAVPAGASESVNITIPAGWYRLYIYGTQAAAGTDPTLLVERYLNVGQTVSTTVPGEDVETGVPTYGAIDLELANTEIDLFFTPIKAGVGIVQESAPIYIPYGLKTTYTKNGGTAIDLTLVARRIG